MRHYTLQFAQAYGAGNYGASTYSCTAQQQAAGTCTTAAGGTATGSSGGGLANTGIAVMAIVTLACLIIFVALAVRLWRRKSAPVAQEVLAEDSTEPESENDETPGQG